MALCSSPPESVLDSTAPGVLLLANHAQVVGRVLGTIVGASLGLAIDYIPGVFNKSVLMLVFLGLACVLLGVIARAQARIGVALAILTLLSVTLCTYESACCTPGLHMSILDVYLARMGAVSRKLLDCLLWCAHGACQCS